MLGSVIGDIAGSVYEASAANSFDESLLNEDSHFTDDTVIIGAVAQSLIRNSDLSAELKSWVRRYPGLSYGQRFKRWCATEDSTPYGSFGNGGALQMPLVALFSRTEAQLLATASRVAGITHEHPDALRASTALAHATFAAIQGAPIDAVLSVARRYLGTRMDGSVALIRGRADFTDAAVATVPAAILCALEATSFEQALHNAIAIGGDTDTVASMAGGLAEALFGISERTHTLYMPTIPHEVHRLLAQVYASRGRHFPLQQVEVNHLGSVAGMVARWSSRLLPTKRRL